MIKGVCLQQCSGSEFKVREVVIYSIKELKEIIMNNSHP